MNRDWLEALPHTHRNRFLPADERALLLACHQRKEHREAERRLHHG